jgi:hypothetical protein
MNRKRFIQIHVALASFFLPYLLLMPLSGSLYLLDIKGTEQKSPAFSIEGVAPSGQAESESFFREQFEKNQTNYSFEYLKKNGNDFLFRPTSKNYYTATKTETGYQVELVQPDITRRIIELHKGHGPKFMRTVEIAFGAALILVTLSGMWLAMTVAAYRTLTFGAFGIGAILVALAMLF